MRNLLFVVLLAFVGGCFTSVTADSTRFLRPDQSEVAVGMPVDATAVALLRVFATRGVVLVDRQAATPAGSTVIKLAGGRDHVGYGNDYHRLGSIYYARIEPISGGSRLTLVGKPVVDGDEPCTPATSSSSQLDCPDVSIESRLDGSVTGQEEAAMIHGVLSEVQLDASAASPGRAATAAANARAVQAGQTALNSAAKEQADCLVQRHADILDARERADGSERTRRVAPDHAGLHRDGAGSTVTARHGVRIARRDALARRADADGRLCP